MKSRLLESDVLYRTTIFQQPAELRFLQKYGVCETKLLFIFSIKIKFTKHKIFKGVFHMKRKSDNNGKQYKIWIKLYVHAPKK